MFKKREQKVEQKRKEKKNKGKTKQFLTVKKKHNDLHLLRTTVNDHSIEPQEEEKQKHVQKKRKKPQNIRMNREKKTYYKVRSETKLTN